MPQFRVELLRRAPPHRSAYRSAAIGPRVDRGSCLGYAPKAPGLVSEGQRPGTSAPHDVSALKGQNSDGCCPFRAPNVRLRVPQGVALG